MARIKLTEETVAGLASDGRDRLYFDSLESGFGVRVTPAGTKIFMAQARIGGRSKKFKIGRWPTIRAAQARSEARAMLADIRAGNDPRASKAVRAEELAAGGVSVAKLADRWMAEHVRLHLKPRTIEDYQRIVEKIVVPEFGSRAVGALRRKDVAALHVRMAKTPRRANYVISVIRAMFSFAERIELRVQNNNPAKGIQAFKEGRSERFLSPDEITLAASLIDGAEASGRVGPHLAAGLRLCLFTGCRSGEATAAEWSHVDWNRKLILLPDSKANRPRIIHLNGPAMANLERLPKVGKYIVAGGKPDQPAKNLRGAWIKIRGTLADVRLHDFRHSFASVAVAKGLSLPMIGKLLGHSVPATTARYAHLAIDPVAEANELIGGVYEEAVTKPKQEQSGANVVSLAKRRKRLFK